MHWDTDIREFPVHHSDHHPKDKPVLRRSGMLMLIGLLCQLNRSLLHLPDNRALLTLAHTSGMPIILGLFCYANRTKLASFAPMQVSFDTRAYLRPTPPTNSRRPRGKEPLQCCPSSQPRTPRLKLLGCRGGPVWGAGRKSCKAVARRPLDCLGFRLSGLGVEVVLRPLDVVADIYMYTYICWAKSRLQFLSASFYVPEHYCTYI